jgi:hypothetical protein
MFPVSKGNNLTWGLGQWGSRGRKRLAETLDFPKGWSMLAEESITHVSEM